MQNELSKAWERSNRNRVLKRLNGYRELEEQIRKAKATKRDLQREIDGLKSPHLTDMPRGSGTSDRVYTQTLKLPETTEQIMELSAEIIVYEAELEQIRSAIEELNQTERFVIECRYIKAPSKKRYKILARNRGYAEGTLKNAHTSAIKKLTRFL